MRNFLLIIAFFPLLLFSQTYDLESTKESPGIIVQRIKLQDENRGEIRGSYYFFDSWKRKAYLISRNTKTPLENFNFNLRELRPEIKIKEDSAFAILLNAPYELEVDERKFRVGSITHPKRSLNEVLFESSKICFYKTYDLDARGGYVKGEEFFPDRYSIDSYLYLSVNSNKPVLIKLRKKRFLRVFKTTDEKNSIANLASRHHLSFNKENEVIQILNLYSDYENN